MVDPSSAFVWPGTASFHKSPPVAVVCSGRRRCSFGPACSFLIGTRRWPFFVRSVVGVREYYSNLVINYHQSIIESVSQSFSHGTMAPDVPNEKPQGLGFRV